MELEPVLPRDVLPVEEHLALLADPEVELAVFVGDAAVVRR